MNFNFYSNAIWNFGLGKSSRSCLLLGDALHIYVSIHVFLEENVECVKDELQ